MTPVPKVSFEFFPPKTEQMATHLRESIRRLTPLNPAFVSVTYGAGGSTRTLTHDLVRSIQGETGIEAAAHLTCIGAVRTEIDAVARDYWAAGIRHIVALRGDPQQEKDQPPKPYAPVPGGYDYAMDLVAGLRRINDFRISVAAYPETHPEAPSAEFDLDNLKRKCDAGASQAITQFFFDTDAFARFFERARKAGITVPIVPGILPVTNFARTVSFARTCGASVTRHMADLFEGLDADPTTRQLVAASFAIEQCTDLQKLGIDRFHFYTLNRAELTAAICHRLGLRPATSNSALKTVSA